MSLVVKGKKTDDSYEFLQLDDSGRLKVTTAEGDEAAQALLDEVIVAGANSALGQIGTVVNAATVYIRCPAADGNYSKVLWRVSADTVHDIQKYRARTIVDAPTITFNGSANGDTTIVNGYTFTGHTDTGCAPTRTYAVDGASDAIDAYAFCNIFNSKSAVTLASCADDETDYLTINNGLTDYTYTAAAATDITAGEFINTTDVNASVALALCVNHKSNVVCASVAIGDKVHLNGKTYTAAATADVPNGVFAQITSNSATGTSLALCVNHKSTITLASANVGDEVTIDNGLDTYTYTAAATAQTCNRKFSQAGSDTADALSLVAGINDPLYGVPGVVASSALGVVTLTPNYGYIATPTAGVGGVGGVTRIVCVTANGVPGISAGSSSGTVSFTRLNAETEVDLSSSSGTTLACSEARGVPGVNANRLETSTAEVQLTPTWATSVKSTSHSAVAAHIVCANDLGVPGVTASCTVSGSPTAVVTLTSTAATALQCVDGVGSHHACADTGTLLALTEDGAISAARPANNTTKGTYIEQTIYGEEELYLGITNKSGAGAMTLVVGATLVP